MPLFFWWGYLGLSWVLYVVAVPLLLALSCKRKYRHSIPARFFLWRNPRPKDCDVWLHACSLGEVKSLEPLIKALKSERILLSVITQTGFNEAKRLYPDIQVAFLPFEPFLPFWSPACKYLGVVEAELWFGLFHTAKQRGAKTLLLSARLSLRSYPKYFAMRFFYERFFRCVDEVLAQRAEDSERFMSLGAQSVHIVGNLKLSNHPIPTRTLPKPKQPLFIAASTHEGEEELILEAFSALNFPYRLALVPRHPERFGAVWQLLVSRKGQKKVARLSENPSDLWEAQWLLVDKMGELNNFYAIADVVILGGSFFPIGGHNPLESAYFGCKLLSGIYVYNQLALFECIEGYRLIDAKLLSSYLADFDKLPNSKIVGKPLELDTLLAFFTPSSKDSHTK